MADESAGSVGEFLDFMPEVVTINAYVSTAVNGVITYSPTGVDYPARIEMKNHLVVDRQGRTVVARGKVFMGTTTPPDIKDKLTLPSQYTPVSPPVIDVNPTDDEFGIHHVTLEIG